MPTPAEKRATFRRLHENGCFVIPNPWDVGSALYLQGMGFKALATTSAGFAWSRGAGDGRVTRDMALAHIAELSAAAAVPMNADFEGGFADAPADVAESVRLCVATGVSGLSIEDYTGDRANPLYAFDLAVARIEAARAAIDKTGSDVLLTGRSEGFIRGKPDLEETIRRLEAFAHAGADCLYAPGISTREQIAAVVKAVAPKPVNLLMGSPSELSVNDIAALGVRRISVGGSLARSAWGGFHPRGEADHGGRQFQCVRRRRGRRRAQQGVRREEGLLVRVSDAPGSGSDTMAPPQQRCRTRKPGGSDTNSVAVCGPCVRRMARVAPAVLRTNVHDARVRVLGLDLEGGNERVFGLHHGVVGFSFQLQPDGETHRRWPSARYTAPFLPRRAEVSSAAPRER